MTDDPRVKAIEERQATQERQFKALVDVGEIVEWFRRRQQWSYAQDIVSLGRAFDDAASDLAFLLEERKRLIGEIKRIESYCAEVEIARRVQDDAIVAAVDHIRAADCPHCDAAAELLERLAAEKKPESEYVKRLEQMAVDGDGYRCEACRLVFDSDDVEFGEDCVLCKPCADALRSDTQGGDRPATESNIRPGVSVTEPLVVSQAAAPNAHAALIAEAEAYAKDELDLVSGDYYGAKIILRLLTALKSETEGVQK